MADDTKQPGKAGFYTRLSHAGRAGTNVRGFVNPAVHRGSTMLYAKMADRVAAAFLREHRRAEHAYARGGNRAGNTGAPRRRLASRSEFQVVVNGFHF